MEPPAIHVGTREEYQRWAAKAEAFLAENSVCPDQLERVDSTINYRANLILLFNLQDPASELSVADTLAHELLHALLDQLGERRAARTLDLVARPVLERDRRGGV